MAITLDGTTGITAPGVTDTGNLSVAGTSTLTGAVSQTSSSTAASFIPTGSTVPANGMYLSAANTLNLATNTTSQVSISSGGIVTGTAGNLMLVSGTAQASTSGTSIPFTSIPSWVKRITVMFNAVSTNGTANFQVQVGTGGSPTISGYSSGSSYTGGANTITFVSGTTGMVIANGNSAAVSLIGQMVFTLQTGNAWVQTHTYYNVDGRVGMGGGNITLSGSLDNIRVIASTTGNPADTFDAGSINILYE